jgi:hypothetical protein
MAEIKPGFAAFWMVYVQGRALPTKQHQTEREALTEASRLARKEHAIAFVLKTVLAASAPERPIVILEAVENVIE